MKTVTIGGHYTYDDGNKYGKVIMFITDKGKYKGEDVYFYYTTSLNAFGEVFEKDFELDFFENDFIRISTTEEIQHIRSKCPINNAWVKKKMEEIIKDNWDAVNERPEIVFDPDEPLETTYLGAFDSKTKSILFRSELLILCDMEKIEMVLKHELCHWYLFVTGHPFLDGDLRFAMELIRLELDETVNMHNAYARQAYETAKEIMDNSSQSN